MIDFDDIPVCQEEKIVELANSLDEINYQIAELSEHKRQLEERLAKTIDHKDDCTKTYVYGKYKITLKTGYIYSLDKEEYLTIGCLIPKCFNPVRQVTKYEIDKGIVRDAEKYASKEELELLAQCISKKPSKLHVAIKAAV